MRYPDVEDATAKDSCKDQMLLSLIDFFRLSPSVRAGLLILLVSDGFPENRRSRRACERDARDYLTLIQTDQKRPPTDCSHVHAPLEALKTVERVKGIEPSLSAREACSDGEKLLEVRAIQAERFRE